MRRTPMLWQPQNLVALQNLDDTYEHETVFYNYDGSAYASAPLTTSSWDSNLPSTYLDSQAMDSSNERNIAVGTFDPTDITAHELYWYWIRLKGTSSNSSMYKISGQKARSNCETGTWCVLKADAIATLIPFKSQFKAPEMGRDYMYEWESNDEPSLADRTYLGDWATGVISSTSDKDFFVFNVPSARTVRFILKNSSIPDIDYDIQIIERNSNKHVMSGINGGNADEVFEKYLQAGDYFVHIYPWSGSNTQRTYSFIAY